MNKDHGGANGIERGRAEAPPAAGGYGDDGRVRRAVGRWIVAVSGLGSAGGGVASMLAPLLDKNRDGSIVDDVSSMIGRFMKPSQPGAHGERSTTCQWRR